MRTGPNDSPHSLDGDPSELYGQRPRETLPHVPPLKGAQGLICRKNYLEGGSNKNLAEIIACPLADSTSQRKWGLRLYPRT